MAHNPSIHVNPSQPTSLVHQADKKYCAADYSFQYVLLSGCVTRQADRLRRGLQYCGLQQTVSVLRQARVGSWQRGKEATFL